jgi:MFS family permease
VTAAGEPTGIYDKTTRGVRIYIATPRLRGLLALNLSVAAAGAMVIVNTVVIVRALLGRSNAGVAMALGCFGGGSMLAALFLPRILDRLPDRRVMISAAIFLGVVLTAFAALLLASAADWVWPSLLMTWTLLGLGYSSILTPTGRLLRRSAEPADRPAVFAAQFALSHACWLVTYPLAGWLGTVGGMPTTLGVLAALTLLGAAIAAYLWPAADPELVEHEHPELPPDHPHLSEGHSHGGRRDDRRHAHAFVIDELHRIWPVDTSLRKT